VPSGRYPTSTFVLGLDGVGEVASEAAAAFRAFVGTVIQAPVLVVATGSNRAGGLLAEIARTPGAEPIELQRLSLESTGQIVQSLLGEVEGSTAIVEHVHAESGGYPGATERAVRALVASGAIVARGDAWVVAPHLGGKLPTLSADDELREIASASLQLLTSSQRRVAEAAASLGLEFDAPLLARLVDTEMGEGELGHALDALVDAQVVLVAIDAAGLERSSAYRFAHRATRDVLLEGIDSAAGAAWSERIVAALSARSDDHSPHERELLARHLLACGRSAEAAEIAAQIARDAAASGLVTDAPALLRAALDAEASRGRLALERWCELSCGLAEIERRRGNPEEAVAWYERVLVAAESQADPGTLAAHAEGPRPPLAVARWSAVARRELGDLLMERGESTGRDTLQAAVRQARELGEPGLLGQAAYTLANRLTLAGRHDEAADLVAEALRTAEQSEERELRARVLKLRATLNWYRGMLDEAESDARHAAAEYEALGLPRGAAVALGALGNALLSQAKLEPAQQVCRDALDYARQAQWLHGQAKLENSLAIVLFQTGDFDGAYEHWRGALTIAERTSNRVDQVVMMSNVGLVAALRGDERPALSLYSDALTIARDVEFRKGEALVLGNLGELHGAGGRAEEARRTLRQGLSIAEAIGAKDQQVECERRLLEVDIEHGDSSVASRRQAAEAARDLLARAVQSDVRSELPHIRRVAAQAIGLGSDGHDEAAVESARLLEQALSGFEEHGSQYEIARVIRVAAELAARGIVELDRMAGRLDDARKLFRRLGAQPEIDRVRAVAESSDTTVEPPLDPAMMGPLLEVIRQLGTIDDLDELLGRIVDEAIRLGGTDRGFLMLCNREEIPAYRISRGIGGADLDDDQVRLSRSIIGRVVETKRRVLMRDASTTGPSVLGKSVVRLGIRSVACLPLCAEGKLVGLVYLDATTPSHPWEADAVAMLELFVAHAGVAVDRARRLDEERRRAELVVTGAHELTNPLRAILGYARLLEQKLHGQGGDVQAHAAIVRQEATRLSRMAAGLIDLAGAEPSRLRWTAVSVQVKDVAQTAAAQIRPLAEINGVELVVRIPGGLPTLFGNRERLIQAATSLLATAVSLSGAGGRAVLCATSTASDSDVSQALQVLRPARDPLLPEPAVGYELCADTPVRIDVESLPKPSADPAQGSGRASSLGTARDAVFQQLGRKDAPAAGADVGRKDPALTIAQQVVRHHGGKLWAERLSSGGTRMSMAFSSLEQRDDGAPDAR